MNYGVATADGGMLVHKGETMNTTLDDATLDEIEADLHNRPLIVLEVDVTHLIAALRASREREKRLAAMIIIYLSPSSAEVFEAALQLEIDEAVIGEAGILTTARAALGEE